MIGLLQLTARHKSAAPVNRQLGDGMIIASGPAGRQAVGQPGGEQDRWCALDAHVLGNMAEGRWRFRDCVVGRRAALSDLVLQAQGNREHIAVVAARIGTSHKLTGRRWTVVSMPDTEQDADMRIRILAH